VVSQTPALGSLLAEVEAVLGSRGGGALARHLKVLATALGCDRPPVWDDPSFVVLLAISLSPRTAISYQTLDPRPRWHYIYQYLKSLTDGGREELERVARLLARILDAREKDRFTVVGDVDRLLVKQRGQCAICKLPFHGTSAAILQQDPFRPLWHAPFELTRPEIDHIEPVGWAGENQFENLQLLCRACNAAKADGVRIPLHREAAIAGLSVDCVPRIHLFRLLVWLASERKGKCEIGGCLDRELTIRLTRPGATIVRANLRLACYECSPVQSASF